MSIDLTPYRKKLFITRHGKNKFGVGFQGAPALWFIRSDFGQLDEQDVEFWANIIHSYNQKCKDATL